MIKHTWKIIGIACIVTFFIVGWLFFNLKFSIEEPRTSLGWYFFCSIFYSVVFGSAVTLLAKNLHYVLVSKRKLLLVAGFASVVAMALMMVVFLLLMNHVSYDSVLRTM